MPTGLCKRLAHLKGSAEQVRVTEQALHLRQAPAVVHQQRLDDRVVVLERRGHRQKPLAPLTQEGARRR